MLSYQTLKAKKIGTVKHPRQPEYLEDFATFDTEWTNVIWEEDGEKTGAGLLYIWQCCLFGDVYYGRTVDEFVSFLRNVTALYGLNNRKRLVIYVHNLSADFQFIRGWMEFDEVMATAKRSVLTAKWGCFEFRCSYKLSNMSLKKFLQQMNVKHQKMPDYDYNGIRTPDTQLSDDEMRYAENDVLGLYEAIHVKMDQEGDDICTIPKTATGYVRRHMRNACLAEKKYKKKFRDQMLTPAQYEAAKKAFRGGNTHCNRAYSGKVLSDVVSYDKTSDYPSACIYEAFPMGRFYKIEDVDKAISDGYAVLMEVEFLDLETSDPIPYLSQSKCSTDITLINLRPEIHRQAIVIDNGRILRAAGWTRMTITEIDYMIITTHYAYKDVRIISAYKTIKRQLPLPIRQTISEMFIGKTELKGVDGQEYFYMKSKNMLNATYGMMVTALVRDVVTLEEVWKVRQPTDVGLELEKYYKRRSSFLHYQWGVWVTAYARKYLQEVIDIAGNNVVYCDTDSVKFIRDDRTISMIGEINSRIRSDADSNDVQCIAYTKKGDEQVLGQWDNDGEYKEFRSYGAKKYAVVDDKGFHITVSGLGKDAASELTCMDDFVLGRTIKNAGRTISVYDDDTTPHYISINGKDYEIRSNMCIIDTTYTLGVTDEYLDLVEELRKSYERVTVKETTVVNGKRIKKVKKVLQFKSAIDFDPD